MKHLHHKTLLVISAVFCVFSRGLLVWQQSAVEAKITVKDLKKITTQAQKSTTQAATAVSVAAKDSVNAMSILLNKIGNSISTTTQKVETAVQPTVQKVETAVQPVVQKIETAVQPAIQKVETAVQPAIQKVETAVQPVQMVVDASKKVDQTNYVPVGGNIKDNLSAETIQNNIKKYRNYRERFRNKFIYISKNNEEGSNLIVSTTKAFIGRNSDIVNFGDTTAWMGFYLGFLATEYKLLADEKKDTTKTLQELWYAIKALNRLDTNAEPYYGGKSSLNGFLIRDDIPGNWYPVPTANNGPVPFAKKFGTGINRIGYNYYSDKGQKIPATDLEMSQDQVWGMLLGLSLVKHLLPNTPLIIDGQSVNIQQEAKDLTYRMIKYMHSYDTKKVLGKTIKYKAWRIYNPITKKYVARGPMGGPDMVALYAYGFAKAGSWIVGKDMSYKEKIDLERETSYKYFDMLAKNNEIMQIINELKKHGTDEFAGLLLGVIGNIRGSKGPDVIYNNFVKRNYYEFLMLLSNVLHKNGGQNLDKMISHFARQLAEAPEEGPYNFGGTDRPKSDDWTSQNLLWKPYSRGTISLTDNQRMWLGTSEFNGADYMLLHNLFLLTYKAKLPRFTYGK